MKISSLLVASSLLAASTGFVVPPQPPARWRLHQQTRSSFASPSLRMAESDFASAMPAKPKQTVAEFMEESATSFIANLSDRLGDGVDPPPELEALKETRDSDAAPQVMAARIYELMIEQGMLYDTDPETGIMTPTEWDIMDNLETPEVKREFYNLYNYGMNLIAKGMLDVEDCKEIVKERLIDRTGKTPEEFDEWLGF